MIWVVTVMINVICVVDKEVGVKDVSRRGYCCCWDGGSLVRRQQSSRLADPPLIVIRNRVTNTHLMSVVKLDNSKLGSTQQ